MEKHPLRIIPLGGLGEVGRNLMVYEYAGEILVVDAGLMFPENDMLGVDYIIPDMTYLMQRRQQVKGIVITHGHEDHIGAIAHLIQEVPAPIYATPLTRGLVEVKLARNGLLAKAELKTVNAGEVTQIGPFRVEFVHVSHSVPDAVALGIQTPEGLIVHSGDYKFDQTPVDNWPTDFAKLAEFSNRGVLALLADSTNSERPGWTPSERVIDRAFEDIFAQAKGRILVATFASLVSRMQQVANAARNHGRRLAFVGSSMVDNAKMARKLGYLDIPESVTLPLDQALNLPDDEVVLLCTGSQGEPTSILGRLSAGTNRQFEIKDGDTVILSSHPIPGNEEIVYRTINRLFKLGANVFYEMISPVHVSGHASQEEMKLLINLVKPKFFLPIHGEIRHLRQHAKVAQELGIPAENMLVIENGRVVEFMDGRMRLAELVTTSYVFVDGSGISDVDSDILRQRETLSQDGIVMVNVVVQDGGKKLVQTPEIKAHGFTLENNGLQRTIQQHIADKISQGNGNLKHDLESVVRTDIYNDTHRSPVIFVTLTYV
jgi:ribonuclease J